MAMLPGGPKKSDFKDTDGNFDREAWRTAYYEWKKSQGESSETAGSEDSVSADSKTGDKYADQVLERLYAMGWRDNSYQGKWKGVFNSKTWNQLTYKGNSFWLFDNDSGKFFKKMHSGNILKLLDAHPDMALETDWTLLLKAKGGMTMNDLPKASDGVYYDSQI